VGSEARRAAESPRSPRDACSATRPFAASPWPRPRSAPESQHPRPLPRRPLPTCARPCPETPPRSRAERVPLRPRAALRSRFPSRRSPAPCPRAALTSPRGGRRRDPTREPSPCSPARSARFHLPRDGRHSWNDRGHASRRSPPPARSTSPTAAGVRRPRSCFVPWRGDRRTGRPRRPARTRRSPRAGPRPSSGAAAGRRPRSPTRRPRRGRPGRSDGRASSFRHSLPHREHGGYCRATMGSSTKLAWPGAWWMRWVALR